MWKTAWTTDGSTIDWCNKRDKLHACSKIFEIQTTPYILCSGFCSAAIPRIWLASKLESYRLHPPCKTSCSKVLCSSNTACWLRPALQEVNTLIPVMIAQLGAQFPHQKRERTWEPALMGLGPKATSLLYPPGDARDDDKLACSCK